MLNSLCRHLDTEVVRTLTKTWKEGMKWRRLWRRDFTPWCVHTYSHTHPASHSAVLNVDQRKQPWPSRPDRAWNKEICAALLPAHRRRQIKMQCGSRGEAQWEQQISLLRYPLLTVPESTRSRLHRLTPNFTGRSEVAGMLWCFLSECWHSNNQLL